MLLLESENNHREAVCGGDDLCRIIAPGIGKGRQELAPRRMRTSTSS